MGNPEYPTRQIGSWQRRDEGVLRSFKIIIVSSKKEVVGLMGTNLEMLTKAGHQLEDNSDRSEGGKDTDCEFNPLSYFDVNVKADADGRLLKIKDRMGFFKED